MKETPRESMVFYKSNMSAAKLMGLTAEQRCEFYEALINYACCDEMPESCSPVIQGLFAIAKANIDANIRKYDQRVKAVENGKKGGAPKGNKNAAKHKKGAATSKDAKAVAASVTEVPAAEVPAAEVPTKEKQSTEMSRPDLGAARGGLANVTTVETDVPVSAARVSSRNGSPVPQGKIQQKSCCDMKQRYDAFCSTIKPYINAVDHDALIDFVGYWTEPNRNKSLMRFEMQKSWDLGSRLTQWIQKRRTLRYYR